MSSEAVKPKASKVVAPVLTRGMDYIGVSVCAIVHDGSGRIVMMKRGIKARDEHGRWDIMGGSVDFGETVEDALRRELLEELCVKPIEMQFLTAYEAHRVYEGRNTHWIALLHAVRVNPNKVSLGEPQKFDEIGWFTQATLPTPRHSQFDKALQAAIQGNIIF